MKYYVPVLYRQRIPELAAELAGVLDRGIGAWRGSAPAHNRIQLFFRADDTGVPSERFTKLIRLFQKHQLPLCLAVVPAWLTDSRAQQLLQLTGSDSRQWCWHQHGRLHKNFEPHGKKQEFGPARAYGEVRHHLRLGQERLQRILGQQFSPYFTPPWNRCSLATVRALQSLGFLGISRFAGAKPEVAGILPDIPVNVDLHTRKEATPDLAAAALFFELQSALAGGSCGIMIHHQLMNDNAFYLLDLLLAELSHESMIEPGLYPDLTGKTTVSG